MKILPLRNMVLVRFEPESIESPSGLYVVRDPKQVRPAEVLAVGPECRDVKVGMVALVNSIAGTSVGDNLLVPEGAIIGIV